MTYNALGKSIAIYAAPIWSTNASDSRFKKIQTAQNSVLRTDTGAHMMASIDHLHHESLTLKVRNHSDMLSEQYLVNCLEEDHMCHGITTQEPRPRPMKKTPHSRHHSPVLQKLGTSKKNIIHNLHTHAVDSDIQLQGNNRVLKDGPPPISYEEQNLNRKQRYTLTTTIRTLPSTAGLQAEGIRRTKRHLYRLWSFATGCDTPVYFQHTPDGLNT